ncbi:MAG: 4-(cytidine 5'-diphospho)-2-C-methyl-D-erythritol kinase [Actinobacteria bacterium HGW-Actinobacteria-4]|nr:MAG: 4-(cytidine 5'-diphospho)-2-C-methyl-D-erythritol kinase [Actinobacteria bacterium HGW-Actinobacteria-4]
MTRTVRARAAGKVNLQLAVGARGEDGYHPLVSVFQAIGLYETVTATSREDGEFTCRIDGAANLAIAPGSIPLDHTNLAVRAARAVAQRYGVTAGADLHILKGVPVAGGMAGGSADAAAALAACAELWQVGASRDDLLNLAADLGADVPFALLGHTAVGIGRGDQLSPAMAHGEFHWAFAIDSTGLSTPAVYAELDRQRTEAGVVEHEPRIDADLMRALMSGDAYTLGQCLSNDLEAAALALAPHLHTTIDIARDADALGVVVSGSGPTVAALARSRQHALAIAAHLTARGVDGPVLTASGPVPGTAILSPAS